MRYQRSDICPHATSDINQGLSRHINNIGKYLGVFEMLVNPRLSKEALVDTREGCNLTILCQYKPYDWYNVYYEYSLTFIASLRTWSIL